MTVSDFSNSDVPVVLTIASSDSGAGTGIQADFKTFSDFEVFGTCAVTSVTAQTPSSIRSIYPVEPECLRDQIQAVGEGFPIAAAKTGMLYTAEQVKVVVEADQSQGLPVLVVDPRMISSSGVTLMQENAYSALKSDLLPLARVVTPNVAEAQALAEMEVGTIDELRTAAQRISERFDVACVAKGGDLPGDDVIDILCDEGNVEEYVLPRVDLKINHGAGCVFSAALVACLARGMLISECVLLAKQYVHEALERSLNIGHHHPLNFARKP